MDLIVLVDVEAGASASLAFCTRVVILNAGEALWDENSLVTLLIIECVCGNLSHHLTYQRRVRASPSLSYCHFSIQGTLYFLMKWRR